MPTDYRTAHLAIRERDENRIARADLRDALTARKAARCAVCHRPVVSHKLDCSAR